jgi:hypothetical protein
MSTGLCLHTCYWMHNQIFQSTRKISDHFFVEIKFFSGASIGQSISWKIVDFDKKVFNFRRTKLRGIMQRSALKSRVARRCIFIPKIPNSGVFGRASEWKILVYFCPFGIFYCHLVYLWPFAIFVIIWYIFPRFGMVYLHLASLRKSPPKIVE